MATISKSGITSNQLIKSEHLTRIIDAFNGISSVEILITGSLKTLSSNIVDFESAEFVTGSFKGDGSQLTGIPTGSGGSGGGDVYYVNTQIYDYTGNGISGSQDSTNTTFEVSEGGYNSEEIVGYINGVGYWSGSGLIETDPANGIIDFTTAPDSTDNILIIYTSGSATIPSGSGGTIDTGSFVTLDTTQTISGRKTFSNITTIFSGNQVSINKLLDLYGTEARIAFPVSTYDKDAYTSKAMLFADTGSNLSFNPIQNNTPGTFYGYTLKTANTDRREYILPNKNGTVAMLDDISGGGSGITEITGSYIPSASISSGNFTNIDSAEYFYSQIGTQVSFVTDIQLDGSFPTGTSGSISISNLPQTIKTGIVVNKLNIYFFGTNNPTDEYISAVWSNNDILIYYTNLSGITKTFNNTKVVVSGNILID